MSSPSRSRARRAALVGAVVLGVSGLALPGTGSAATPTSYRVDFTSSTGRVPSGYVRDFGEAYGVRPTGGTWGWVADGTSTPLAMTANGRDRTSGTTTTDLRLQGFVHMQLPAADAKPGEVTTPASWELALPTGDYTVTVGVGDAGEFYDSTHALSIEDQSAVYGFTPSSGDRTRVVTRTVHVGDGRLTLTPSGGANTKLAYVAVARLAATPARPRVSAVAPVDRGGDVALGTSVTAELALTAGGLDAATVTSSTVRLSRADGTAVAAHVNTSGGGDVLVLTPLDALAPGTAYRFTATSGVKDVAGNALQPWSSVFTTTTSTTGTLTAASFTQVATTGTDHDFTSVVVGPDHRLYAGTLSGEILRFPVAADGTLGAPTTLSPVTRLNGGAARTVIGMAFAPGSTATAPVLYVTDNAPYLGVDDVADWQGKVDRLSGPDLGTATTVLTGLPRSNRDHETNSLAFGPDGALYITQASNTAMGSPDVAWGNRPERVLSAAVLRLDLARLPATLPLDVKTGDGGTYRPSAAGAPLTLYATGLRNAFDLVWHSNGHLYAPTNGSAAGGNLPGTTSPLPSACARRIDYPTSGAWTGPAVAGITNNGQTEPDWLFNVRRGGYYGHPDPARCEWVLNGGNPTSGADPRQVTKYPVGTLPDRNYRVGDVYDAGAHASADGALEYRGNAFGGSLAGKLLVVRYSAGQDVVVFDPSGADGAIVGETIGISGLGGLNGPLDLAQDVASGCVYVTELGGRRITMLRPNA